MSVVFFAILDYKAAQGGKHFGTERFGVAIPDITNQSQNLVKTIGIQSLEFPESSCNAANSVVAPLMGVVQIKANTLDSFIKCYRLGVFCENQRTHLRSSGNTFSIAKLLCKQNGFVFCGHVLIQPNPDRQLFIAVKDSECLDGVLAVENIEVAIALTNLGIIKQTGVKVFSDAIGSVILMSLFAFLYSNRTGTAIQYGWLILYLFLASVIGQFGDLAMSTIKRTVGIKDFGEILPGHGDILDRFDSFLFAAPFAVIYGNMTGCFL